MTRNRASWANLTLSSYLLGSSSCSFVFFVDFVFFFLKIWKILLLFLLARRDHQIPEMRHCRPLQPECNAPRRLAVLHIFYDQTGLLSTIDEKFRLLTGNHNLDLVPLTGHQVHVRFIDAGILLAQPEPGILRMRDILGRMISPELIFRPAIGGTYIETLITRRIRLPHPERDADKASG